MSTTLDMPVINRPRPVNQTGESGRIDWNSPISTVDRTSGQHRMQRYEEALRNLPPSGGDGCHSALLGVANLGFFAGLTGQQIFSDLRSTVRGSRHVPDSEIMAAINRAAQDYQSPSNGPRWTPPPRPAIDGTSARRRFIARGNGVNEGDIFEASPIRPDCPPEEDAPLLLRSLYRPSDALFIGERTDTGPNHVRIVADWLADPAALARSPHFAPNPMKGLPAPTKGDPAKLTLRGDACVARFELAVVEFDNSPRSDQLAFFAGVDWPIAALIDSGGKSVHALLRVNAADSAAWDAEVRPLFRDRLAPMGVDRACANPSRLSRLPGHRRKDTDRMQRILFLDPTAKGLRYALNGGRI